MPAQHGATIIFSPTTDFFSEAFDSHYCAGLRYTAQPDNARLRAAVAQWVRDGNVCIIEQSISGTSPAQMGGTGNIGG